MGINTHFNASTNQYIITVGEDFSFNSYADFRAASEKMPAAAKSVEIDLQKATKIDSSALGMLLLMREQVEHQVSKVKIRNPQPAVLEVLKLASLDTIFEIS
ncbi:MAG: STAS domain-containing protein [Chromatiales bacterium]|nr:STAS domain-containing protein [Chromatiales bacterium]